MESGNVNVMDKMIVSGYDVKVSGINQQVPIMSVSYSVVCQSVWQSVSDSVIRKSVSQSDLYSVS